MFHRVCDSDLWGIWKGWLSPTHTAAPHAGSKTFAGLLEVPPSGSRAGKCWTTNGVRSRTRGKKCANLPVVAPCGVLAGDRYPPKRAASRAGGKRGPIMLMVTPFGSRGTDGCCQHGARSPHSGTKCPSVLAVSNLVGRTPGITIRKRARDYGYAGGSVPSCRCLPRAARAWDGYPPKVAGSPGERTKCSTGSRAFYGWLAKNGCRPKGAELGAWEKNCNAVPLLAICGAPTADGWPRKGAGARAGGAKGPAVPVVASYGLRVGDRCPGNGVGSRAGGTECAHEPLLPLLGALAG